MYTMHETAHDPVVEMLYCNEEIPVNDSGFGVEPLCTVASQRLENNVYGVHAHLSAPLLNYDDVCYDDVCYDNVCWCGCCEEMLPLNSHVVRTGNAL